MDSSQTCSNLLEREPFAAVNFYLALQHKCTCGTLNEGDRPTSPNEDDGCVLFDGKSIPRDKLQTDLAPMTRVMTTGEIIASIAHEVNQPLAAITTNCETSLRWLARPEPDVAKVRELATRVLDDARRASEIINRLRDMAIGKAPKLTWLSLDGLVEESIAFLRPEFRSKSTSVSLDLGATLPQILVDRTQLQQVVVNLIVNALQAIEHLDTEHRIIFMRTRLSDPETVCCTIEDSGPGINPSHIPHLFDRFFTTKNSGMGMGLAISRSIIEAHGGRILADNNSSLGGARFSFELPLNNSVH